MLTDSDRARDKWARTEEQLAQCFLRNGRPGLTFLDAPILFRRSGHSLAGDIWLRSNHRW